MNLELGTAGGRGIVRYENGDWKGGFSIRIGTCIQIETEQWAALLGMKEAWEMGFRRIILETDSLLTSKWLNGNRMAIRWSRILLKSVTPIMSVVRLIIYREKLPIVGPSSCNFIVSFEDLNRRLLKG